MTSIRSSKQNRKRTNLLVLAGLSGLLYSSWPLGFILNPVATRGLASNLEALHQPYNWLFIGFDILCGLLILAVAVRLNKIFLKPRFSLIVIAIYSYAAFGLTTAVDALIPFDCAADQQQCGNIAAHPLVIVHGLISIVSIGVLTLSLLVVLYVLWCEGQLHGWQLKASGAFTVVWFSFGLGTAYLLMKMQPSAGAQHVFVLLNSLWIFGMPAILIRWQKSRLPAARVAKNRRGV